MKPYYDCSYNEMIVSLKNNNKSLEKFNITILRNITIEPVFDSYMKYFMMQEGYEVNCNYGNYDNVFQEAIEKNSNLFNENVDCVMVFLFLEKLSSIFTRTLLDHDKTEINKEEIRILDYIKSILYGIREQTDALILWNGFEVPSYPLGGILDSKEDCFQVELINNLNKKLKRCLSNVNNAYYIDSNACISRVGSNSFYDRRYWYIAQAPYSKAACKELSHEMFKHIKATKGINRKCIVLDCDNVLWGGIVGEDGLAGINLGQDQRGLPFYEFQQEVINLKNRGVIVAICSKNNEEDVWDVFKYHPYMLLKEEHIVSSRINWMDKATNIKEIAEELNIGLDSIVFVDDSEHEIELVNQMLPQVYTLHMDKKKFYNYRDVISSSGLFDTLNLTNEDKKRTSMYKSEVLRKNHFNKSIDILDYYKSLEMQLTIYKVNDFNISRISQLTQRTNQFNLTTKRYTESDIRQMAQDENIDILCVQLKDRFGDLGMVGVCIIKHESNKSIIDSFLLSCRALGRKVENVLLMESIKIARYRRNNTVIGKYYKTAKNSQVENFYEDNGFVIIEKDGEYKECEYFIKSLDFSVPSFFKSVNSEFDAIL